MFPVVHPFYFKDFGEHEETLSRFLLSSVKEFIDLFKITVTIRLM